MLGLRLVALILAAGLWGCTTQVRNTNTAAADAVEPIYRDQVLSNLAKLLDAPNTLPSQIKLLSGTNQSSGTLSPTVTFPLTRMFASTVSSAPSHTTTTAGAGATLGGNLGYQMTYSTAPTTEIIDLLNLRAVYMAALCSTDQSGASPPVGCNGFDLRDQYTPPRVYDSKNRLVFDGYFLQPPLCILCLSSTVISSTPNMAYVAIDRKDLEVADTLKPNAKWLYWTEAGKSSGLPPGAVPIGESGGREFYATSYAKFARFVLETLPLPASPTRTSGEATILPPPAPPPPPQSPPKASHLSPEERRLLLAPNPNPNPRPTPAPPPSTVVPGSPEGGAARPLILQQQVYPQLQ